MEGTTLEPADASAVEDKGKISGDCVPTDQFSAELEHQDSGYESLNNDSQTGGKEDPQADAGNDEAVSGSLKEGSDSGNHDSAPDATSEAGRKADKPPKPWWADDDSESEAELLPPSPPPEGPYISYKSRWMNKDERDDELFTRTTYSRPTAVDEVDAAEDERQPAFEVTITYISKTYHSVYTRSSFKNPPKAREGPTYAISMRSRVLISALRSVVPYFPDLDLSTSPVTLEAPYRPLALYYEQLREYQHKHDLKREDPECEQSEIYTHLELLLNFVEEQVMRRVRTERELHAIGRCTFQWLWTLFKPGTDVAFGNDNVSLIRGGAVSQSAGVVSNISGGPMSSSYNLTLKRPQSLTGLSQLSDAIMDDPVILQGTGSVSPYFIKMWSMGYNGHRVGRIPASASITAFEGEMPINRLEVVPMDKARAANDDQSLRAYLIEQGKRWYSYLRPSCMDHSGEIMNFPYHKMDGKVMVDVARYFEEKPNERERFIDKKSDGNDDFDIIAGCDCTACDIARRGAINLPSATILQFRQYDNIDPLAESELTEHQYLLCPQVLVVWFFNSRKWETVDVGNLRKAEWNDQIIDTLVLSEKYITLLKALSQGFMQIDDGLAQGKLPHWTADFVKGKGNSRIFLLHGPPGVGKTYTAECMAEFTRRPLMTLNCSDIGTNPSAVEKNLEDMFKKAKKWGAILLIDEADIYLERREKKDLTRNSLVAGFLRALEIYEGILFLTTNRVGAFDDAFISRIHVKLFYPKLTKEERRKILGNFINKLDEERGDQMSIDERAYSYMDGDDFLEKDFNGREIRNIFQTAVGLAEFEKKLNKRGKVTLTRDHVTQVVDMSGDFKKYLKDTWYDMDEEARAGQANLRRETDPDADE